MNEKYNKESAEERIENIIKNKGQIIPKYMEKDTAASKSFKLTNKALHDFNNEIKRRQAWNRKYNTKEEIEEACDDFFEFIFEHELYPTIELLCIWLDFSSETLSRIIKNSRDSRCDTVKKAKEKIMAILTQHTLSKQGNPAGNIFHLKAIFGLTETSNLIVSPKVNETSYYIPENAEEIINSVPKLGGFNE